VTLADFKSVGVAALPGRVGSTPTRFRQVCRDRDVARSGRNYGLNGRAVVRLSAGRTFVCVADSTARRRSSMAPSRSPTNRSQTFPIIRARGCRGFQRGLGGISFMAPPGSGPSKHLAREDASLRRKKACKPHAARWLVHAGASRDNNLYIVIEEADRLPGEMAVLGNERRRHSPAARQMSR
jgi:hypothetical protein